MTTLRYLMLGVAGSAAVLASAAHAQTMTTTEVEETEVTTQVEPTVMPDGAVDMVPTTTYTTTVKTTTVGNEPTVDPVGAATVKLENGTTTQFPDSAAKGWQEYAREQGYTRFTFDPETGLFVVGKGDAKFDGKWDEQGRRIPTAVKPAPKKAKAAEAETPSVAVEDVAPDARVPPMQDTPDATVNPSEQAPAEVMPSVEGGDMPAGEPVSPSM